MENFREDQKNFVTHNNGNLVNIISVWDTDDYEAYPLVEIKDSEGKVVIRENISVELASILLQLGNNIVMADKE